MVTGRGVEWKPDAECTYSERAFVTNYQPQAVRIGVPCFTLGFCNEKCTTPQRTREDWRKESGES